MTIARTALCLLAGASVLAACSPGASNQQAAASGSSAPAAAPSSGPDVTITEADLPHLKPGLWETTTTTTDGGPPEVTRACQTGESIKPKQVSKDCSSFGFKRTFLGDIVIDATCGEHGVSSTMHIKIHGDWDGSMSSDGQISLTIPNQPTRTFTTHSESHYVGPCPASGEG